ncbi:MAG TPA: metallophosphoesterase [Ruminococcus sp.]|nr:metallophosphoesterase [Ruminococcus sp.]
MMWVIIFGGLALLGLVSVFYLVTRFHRFGGLQRMAQQHKLLSWMAAAVPVCAVLCFYFVNLFTMFVVLIHLMVIWALCDLLAKIIGKARKKEQTRYYAGGAALCLTAAVLGSGWYFAHHVYETHYQFETQKDLGKAPLRIVMFADSHLGITLDGASFAAQTAQMQKANPDLVVICGDFVDDDSTKADMLAACEALGKMQTTYGVYYAYGNHDVGYFNNRDFTADDLREALTANGIIMLEDSSVLIDDRFYLIGRLDNTFDRAEAGSLNAALDSSKYQIALDHEPNDYAAEAAAGYDLVLSGHTHGGHIFPAGQIGLLIGANDRIYGTEQREQTQFLVTSGISGWAIPFKTGTISEYCVIDITEAP